MVIGDIHIKRIKQNLINNSFETAKSYVKLFSPAKAPDLKHYIITSLADQKKDIAVNQIGGSDIIILQMQKI